MKKIRVGLIGAGGMASYHIPGFRKAGADTPRRRALLRGLRGE